MRPTVKNKAFSDFDYVIEGINSRQWSKIKTPYRELHPGLITFIDMNLEQAIQFNQFGQDVYGETKLISQFESLGIESKRSMLKDIENLIIQSKSTTDDIDKAISKSGLKPTFTPCVIIKKGLNYGDFQKIIGLPENELTEAFRLFIYLFKEGYHRRYLEEKDAPNKWRYWDLSNDENLERIRQRQV